MLVTVFGDGVPTVKISPEIARKVMLKGMTAQCVKKILLWEPNRLS